MYKRVIGKCKNSKCRQSFGIVPQILTDKNGILTAKCPFCEKLNKVNDSEFEKLLLLHSS